MTDYKVFEKIIKFAEITLTKNRKAYINKYKSDCEEIDYNFIKTLINSDILSLESGNFETGEEHFMLDDKYIKIDNMYNLIGIDVKLMEKNLEIPEGRKPRESFSILQKIFLRFKQNTIRKQKIQKINNL